MIIHDLHCEKCNEQTYDIPVTIDALPKCATCQGPMEIWYGMGLRRAAEASVHSTERTVVFRNPKTGSIAYPGRTDVSMPERYRKGGYEKVEMHSLRELDKFCKDNNLMNHKANFNDGSGAANEY